MYRYTSRLTDRHQAPYDRFGLARAPRQYFAMHVRWNAAHVVVHGGQHRNGLFVDIHACKNTLGLGDARQALMDHFGPQMLEMQMDMILLRPDATSFTDLDGHCATDNIARG